MSHILIAEDEPRIVAFIQKGLHQQGFTTAIAEDGDRAIDLMQRQSFDLMLLDWKLPLKDGKTVLIELRNQGIEQPIIVITACDRDLVAAIADQLGASACILKPFKFGHLLDTIYAQLKRN